jgi:hypothetical protein
MRHESNKNDTAQAVERRVIMGYMRNPKPNVPPHMLTTRLPKVWGTYVQAKLGWKVLWSGGDAIPRI